MPTILKVLTKENMDQKGPGSVDSTFAVILLLAEEPAYLNLFVIQPPHYWLG